MVYGRFLLLMTMRCINQQTELGGPTFLCWTYGDSPFGILCLRFGSQTFHCYVEDILDYDSFPIIVNITMLS